MTEEPRSKRPDRFPATIGRKARRRIKMRDDTDSVWFWLGMLGLVGWSVAVPTVLGVLIGIWLDDIAPASFSWVLSMVVVGLLVGILTAFTWTRRELNRGEDPHGEQR